MTVDKAGRSELHYAALDDATERVAALLSDGFDPSLRDREGFTPLHFAAQQNSISAARLLLEAGAAVDATNKLGNTPLWAAVLSSTDGGDLISLLRDNGADPHHTNEAGQSPIGLARLIADRDVAKFFTDSP